MLQLLPMMQRSKRVPDPTTLPAPTMHPLDTKQSDASDAVASLQAGIGHSARNAMWGKWQVLLSAGAVTSYSLQVSAGFRGAREASTHT